MTLSRVALAAIVLGVHASTADAQMFGDPCGVCTPMQPVLQSCYQTVPVTEYQQVRQTVKRPVYRTEYVEEPVTVYKPVTEVRRVEVPTVQYQRVTAYRTVHRDLGRWVTSYRPNPRMSPCQFDNRPGVIGWLNRTGYQLQSAFRPRYTAIRQYRPQVVACSIPYTRQVAVRGTREVAYNVTRMVPTRTVQKRAVQRLTYVDQEVTVMRPRTTYRTVPIGTSVAYAPMGGPGAVAFGPYGGIRSAEIIDDRPTRSALTPEPDDAFRRSADADESDRSAAGSDGERFTRPRSASRETGAGGSRYERESRVETPAQRSGFTNPVDENATPNRYQNPERSSLGGGNDQPFDVDTFNFDTPSASTHAPAQYIRTAKRDATSDAYTGWRSSRPLTRTLKRETPATDTAISVAKR